MILGEALAEIAQLRERVRDLERQLETERAEVNQLESKVESLEYDIMEIGERDAD